MMRKPPSGGIFMDKPMTDEPTLAQAPGDEIVNLDQADVTSTEVEQKPDEAEANKVEGAGADAGEETKSDDEKPKKLSGSRRERLRREAAERENRELRALLEQTKTSKQDGESEKEPQEADFNGDPFAFDRAWNAWNTRKIIREENSLADKRRQSVERDDALREVVIAHEERVEEAREQISDYDKVLASAHVPVSPDVGREILASDKSALLAYHLAKNPEKLQVLNGMTGKELAREIGRLEGSVRMPAANHKTNAPSPIQPLKGGAAPAFDPSKSSMEDYIAKRASGWSG